MTANQPANKSAPPPHTPLESLEENKRLRQAAIEAHRQAAAPALADLARLGYHLENISDLFNQRYHYPAAVPILLAWLPRVENLGVKETIVRALTVPWARPAAAPALVAEFHKMEGESNTGIKWAIANGLSVVADDRVYAEIVELVDDPRHGRAREMLALALGNMKDPRAQDVLIRLLDDDEVAGHAIMALGKLKSKKAYPAIERFLAHPKTWVRQEAKKALRRIGF